MNDGKSQFNLRNGIVAGFSASAAMTLGHILFDEQTALIRGLLSVVMGVVIALCFNFALKTLRKFKAQR